MRLVFLLCFKSALKKIFFFLLLLFLEGENLSFPTLKSMKLERWGWEEVNTHMSSTPGLPPACDFPCYFLHLGVINHVDSVNMNPKPLLRILKQNSP